MQSLEKFVCQYGARGGRVSRGGTRGGRGRQTSARNQQESHAPLAASSRVMKPRVWKMLLSCLIGVFSLFFV